MILLKAVLILNGHNKQENIVLKIFVYMTFFVFLLLHTIHTVYILFNITFGSVMFFFFLQSNSCRFSVAVGYDIGYLLMLFSSL